VRGVEHEDLQPQEQATQRLNLVIMHYITQWAYHGRNTKRKKAQKEAASFCSLFLEVKESYVEISICFCCPKSQAMLPHTSNAEHPQDRGSAGPSPQLLTTSYGVVERSPKRAELTTSNPQPIMGKHKKSAKPGSVSPPSFESDKSPRGKNPSKQAEFQQLFNLDDEVIEGKSRSRVVCHKFPIPVHHLQIIPVPTKVMLFCTTVECIYHEIIFASTHRFSRKRLYGPPTFLSLPLVG